MSSTAIWYALLEETSGEPFLNLAEADGPEQVLGAARATDNFEIMRAGKRIRRGASIFLVLMTMLGVVAVAALLGAAAGLD